MQVKLAEIRRFRTFLRFVLLLWIGTNVILFLMINREAPHNIVYPGERVFLLLGLLSVLSLEAIIFVLLAGELKTLSCQANNGLLRSAWLLVKVLFVAASALILALVFLSWTLLSKDMGLINYQTLVAFAFDLERTFKHLTPLELRILGGSICLALLTSLSFFLLCPKMSVREFNVLIKAAALSALSALLFLRVGPETFLADYRYKTLRAITSYVSTPLITLCWSHLLYFEGKKSSEIKAKLEARFPLEDYSSSIRMDLQRKNIIFVIVEAMRADVLNKIVEDKLITPFLNKLATHGIAFTNAISQSNESAYAITSLVTGLFPLKYSARDRFTNASATAYRVYDLLSTTHRTAYISSANEKWKNMINYTYSDRLDFFFHSENMQDAALPAPSEDTAFVEKVRDGELSTGKLDDRIAFEEAKRWIREERRNAEVKPFFVTLNLQSSHFPYEQGESILPHFTPNELSDSERASISFGGYSKEYRRVMLNRYWNSLSYIDSLIKDLMDFVSEEQLTDKTILLVTGDHGELFHEHGFVTHAGYLWQEVINVPVVLWGTEKYRPGVYSRPIMLIDLAPMLLDLAELPPYKGFQGSSPLRDEADQSFTGRPIFSSIQLLAQQDVILWGQWKLMRTHTNNRVVLYDLKTDPRELNDVALLYPDIASCLEDSLLQFRFDQISYYESSRLRERYFPPRYEADFVSCSKKGSSPSEAHYRRPRAEPRLAHSFPPP